jgi:uncharacterized protein YndB with AHSA1/START domain
MTTQMETQVGTQVYQVYIKATPQAIWDAITDPEWSSKYAYRCSSHFDMRPGGAFKVIANEGMRAMGLPEVIVDGEVIEADPPHKLVQSYRFLFEPADEAEGFARVTYEIVPCRDGVSRLTVTHDQLEDKPRMVGAISSLWSGEDGGGGWNWILSDLKSLLETGKTLTDA